MAASDEIDEMHLTPAGWVQGSSKIDFAGWKHVDALPDRLLTVSFREYMSSSFSKMDMSTDIKKHASDSAILAALRIHGTSPKISSQRYSGWPEFLAKIGFN
jgi:hypothetical protein